jgi:pyruvate formate lyase activating enzyme
MAITGLIFDIQRFSIHDGPGIRTTIFFKGCSLRCFWCHNPEGVNAEKQIQYQPNRCIQCGACFASCPEGAHQFIDGVHEYDRSLCKSCGACIEVCYSDALQRIGREVTVTEVMSEVLADRVFYETSGGGVTLSGGEPALQNEFAYVVLAACKKEGLHAAIETAGNVPWFMLENLVPVTDLFMMDLKIMDPIRHKQVTGVTNSRILENASRLAGLGKNLLFRTPIVPTVNDTQEDIQEIANFIRSLSSNPTIRGDANPYIRWELLPFHRLAADKYRGLGMEYRAENLTVPTQMQMSKLASIAKSSGVPVLSPM